MLLKLVHCRHFWVARWWLQALFSEVPGLLLLVINISPSRFTPVLRAFVVVRVRHDGRLLWVIVCFGRHSAASS